MSHILTKLLHTANMLSRLHLIPFPPSRLYVGKNDLNPFHVMLLKLPTRSYARNCWGLGRSAIRRYLVELRRQHRPGIMFLSETKKAKGKLNSLKRRLCFINCLEVEARGRSGGLALLWESDVNQTVCSYSTNHIGSVVETVEGKWRFMGIYGF